MIQSFLRNGIKLAKASMHLKFVMVFATNGGEGEKFPFQLSSKKQEMGDSRSFLAMESSLKGDVDHFKKAYLETQKIEKRSVLKEIQNSRY